MTWEDILKGQTNALDFHPEKLSAMFKGIRGDGKSIGKDLRLIQQYKDKFRILKVNFDESFFMYDGLPSYQKKERRVNVIVQFKSETYRDMDKYGWDAGPAAQIYRLFESDMGNFYREEGDRKPTFRNVSEKKRGRGLGGATFQKTFNIAYREGDDGIYLHAPQLAKFLDKFEDTLDRYY